MKTALRPERILALLLFLFVFAILFAYPSLSPSSQSDVSSSASKTEVQTSPTTTATNPVSRSLWVGEEKTVIAVSLSDGQPNLYISSKHVEDLAVDNSRGVVWVGTKKEIIQYKFDGSEIFRHPLKHRRRAKAGIDQVKAETGEKTESSVQDQNNDKHEENCDDKDNGDVEIVRISLDPSDGSLWVGAGKEVFKLSFDNRELFRLTGFNSIADVSVDIVDGHCWVAQKRTISKHASDGTEIFNFALKKGNESIALAADPSSHGLWIGSKKGLIKVDSEGAELFKSKSPDDIQDLKVNTATNSLWLVTKKDVYKYTKDGQKLFMLPLCSKHRDDDQEKKHDADKISEANPSCSDDDHERKKDCEGNLITPAVDSLDNTVWIASRKTLFKLSDAGDLLLKVPGFIQIQALDIGLPKIGITITEPQDGSVFTVSPITIKGIITDPTATVDVNGTKATVTGLDFEAKDIALSPGVNSIIATATNLAQQKATDTIKVTYNPPNAGPTLLLCPEPYGEQRPHPPTPGCSQQVMLGDIHWDRGYVLGQADDSVDTVLVDGATLAPGGYIYNQGRILQAGWTGAFFWARMLLSGPDGSYPVTATVTNDQGQTATATVSFIKDSVAPNVFITSPSDGTLTNSQAVTVTGTVDDSTAVVQLEQTGANIPVVNGAFTTQYDMGAVDGLQYIYINAIDPAGNQGYAYTTITRDATPPQINVTAPTDGLATNSQTVSISGTIVDQNPGTITVSINNAPAQLLTSSGSSFSGTITLTSGANALLYTAIDRAGNTSTLSRNVTLDQEPPTAIITGVVPNASLTGTATITVDAADVLSGIQSVTLLVDGILRTTLTKAPYTFNLDSFGLSAGNHTITIRVLDRAGNITEQNIPVTVQHQFGIQITSPGAGATINKSSALIRGTINYPSGQEIGVTVNGVPAEQQGTNFAAIVPLQQGQNTITAIATNIYGVQEQNTITINTDSIQDQLRFIVSPASGITMQKTDGTIVFDTIMNVESYVTGTIASYAWDTNGDGTAEQTGATLTQITATYQVPGLYFPTVTVTDTIGNTYTESAVVNVIDRNTIDTLLKAKWEGMKGSLTTGNIEGALNQFAENARVNYRTIFNNIAARLPALVAGMQTINMVKANGRYAEYYIKRQQRGAEISYFIYFVKDANGIWKIQQF